MNYFGSKMNNTDLDGMGDQAMNNFNAGMINRRSSGGSLGEIENPGSEDDPRAMFSAVQQQYQEDMHDLLDDISMPNQSMTISNLSQISQSPFRGGTTPTRGAFNFGGGIGGGTGGLQPSGSNTALGDTQSATKLSGFTTLGSKSQTSLSISNSNLNNEHTNYSQQQMILGSNDASQQSIAQKIQQNLQKQTQRHRKAQVYANETLGVNSSSDEDIDRGARGAYHRSQAKSGEVTQRPKDDQLQFKKSHNRSQAQIPQEVQQEQLDIRELSIQEERKPTSTNNGRNSPNFSGNRQEIDHTDIRIGGNPRVQQPQFTRTSALSKLDEPPDLNDQSQMVTDRSNLGGFQMNFDCTPVRAGDNTRITAHATPGDNAANGKQNRTFADSVLLQGMMGGGQTKKAYAGDLNSKAGNDARKDRFGAYNSSQEEQDDDNIAGKDNNVDMLGASSNSVAFNNNGGFNGGMSRADLSDISTLTANNGPRRVFRMDLPKTPDRPDGYATAASGAAQGNGEDNNDESNVGAAGEQDHLAMRMDKATVNLLNMSQLEDVDRFQDSKNVRHGGENDIKSKKLNGSNPNAGRQEEDDDISAMSTSQIGGGLAAMGNAALGNVSQISGLHSQMNPYLMKFKSDMDESLSPTPNPNHNQEIQNRQRDMFTRDQQLNEGNNIDRNGATIASAGTDGQPQPLTASLLGLQKINQKHIELQNKYQDKQMNEQSKEVAMGQNMGAYGAVMGRDHGQMAILQERRDVPSSSRTGDPFVAQNQSMKRGMATGGGDLELEEAIQDKKEGMPSGGGDQTANLALQESEKLRVELSLVNTRVISAGHHLQQTQHNLAEMEQLAENQRKTIVDLENKVAEVNDQNRLLQQQQTSTSQLPSFLSRAQENARREISSLKSQLNERDQIVAKLHKELQNEQTKEQIDHASLIQELQNLCKQVDQYKLLSQSLKNQMQSKEQESQQEIQKMRQCYESEFGELTIRMQQMDQYIQSIVKEYQDKDYELQASVQNLQKSEAKLQEVERAKSALEKEVQGYQERCKSLEVDLQAKTANQSKTNPQQHSNSLEFEIEKQRQTYTKQISQLKEEKQSLSLQLTDVQNKLKSITTDPLQIKHEREQIENQQQIEQLSDFIKQIAILLQIQIQSQNPLQNQQEILDRIQKMAIESEEHTILKQEYEMLQTSYQSQSRQTKKYEQEVQDLQKQIQTLQRQSSSNPTSFTKTLLAQKDEELSTLRADLANERKARIDLDDQHWHIKKENEVQQIHIKELEKRIKETQEERDKAFEADQNKTVQIRNSEQRVRDETKRLEEKVVDCQEEIEVKVREIERLKDERQGLRERAGKLQDENEEVSQRVNQYDKLVAKKIGSRAQYAVARFSIYPEKRLEPKPFYLTRATNTEEPYPERGQAEQQSEHQSLIDDLNEQISTFKTDQALQEKAHSKKLQILTNEKHDLRNELQNMANATQQVQKEFEETIGVLQQSEDELERRKMESEEMEREMERMTENEKKIIEELAHLRSQSLLKHQEQKSTAPDQDDTLKEEVQKLEQDLAAKSKLIDQLQSQINSFNQGQSQNQEAKDNALELIEKQKLIDNLNQEIEDLREQVDLQADNEQRLLDEAQTLQESVAADLKLRMEQLDQEYQDIENEKEQMRQLMRQEMKEKEQKFEDILRQKEAEFEMKEDSLKQKFQRQIQSIEGEHQDGKESLISDMLEDHKKQIESMKAGHKERIDKIEQEHQAQVEDLTKEAEELRWKELDRGKKSGEERVKKAQIDLEKEAKKLREDLDRAKKMNDEKIKKISEEHQADIERTDFDTKEKMSQLTQKHKKDIKTAQEKLRPEMKNSVDAVKNDMARAKCDWDREKKKLIQEHEDQMNQLRNQLEDENMEEQRVSKEKADKQFKKRLQDKENLWQAKFEEIEQEVGDLNEAHRIEIKNERERIETRVREQVRAQVRVEISNELEEDFSQQTQEIESRYRDEIEKLQRDLRAEKSQNLPSLNMQQKSNDPNQRSQGVQTEKYKPSTSEIGDAQLQLMEQEIKQIKGQYDQKLQNFVEDMKSQTPGTDSGPDDGKAQKNEIIKHFETVLNYEFEKILMSLRMKSKNLSQDELNSKRNDINKLIQKVLYQNKDSNLKKCMDGIKKKISDVLKLFKESLEDKSNKRIKELEQKIEELQQNESNLKAAGPKRADHGRQSIALMSEQNYDDVSANKSFQNQNEDLIPQKYISSHSKQGMKNQVKDRQVSLQPGEDEEEYQILQRLEPQMTNAKGQIVVEVEKVLKDLQVLYQSMKASKFFKLCIQNNGGKTGDSMPPETIFDVTQSQDGSTANSSAQGGSTIPQDQIVKRYRDLLNYLFKLIVKLNSGAEQLSRQNELYRLKLLNQDLREQLYKAKHEVQKQLTQDKVNEIVEKLTADQLLMNMLSQDALNVLSKIQELAPNLTKLLEHQRALLELFTVNNQHATFQINKNCAEINQKCQIYLEQFDDPARTQMHDNEQDFTIQNSFDQMQNEPQYDYDQDSIEHHHEQHEYFNNQNQTQQNMFQDNQSIQNANLQQNLQLSLDMISQDQAVDLLAQVFQKLNINNQTQNFMSANNHNQTQENIMNITNNTLMGAIGGGMSREGGARSRGALNQNVYASQQYQPRRETQQSTGTINNTTNLMMLGSIDAADQTADQPGSPDHLDQAEPAATEDNFIGLGHRGPGGAADRLMDKTVLSAVTGTNNQNYANENNAINEDCIKQAESLLQMFKQGGHLLHETTSASASVTNSGNLPVQQAQQQKARARMGSTHQGAGIASKIATINNSMISQQFMTQQEEHQNQRGLTSQRQSQQQPKNLMPPLRTNKQQPPQNLDSSNNNHLKSLDLMSNISASAFSSGNQGNGLQRRTAPPVPPLQLKKQRSANANPAQPQNESFATSKSLTTLLPPGNDYSKGNTVILSQQKNQRGAQNLSSADEYYAYHKRLKSNQRSTKDPDQQRRTNSQIQLKRIEGVVSPISANKLQLKQEASSMRRQDSLHSAAQMQPMQLKPPSLQRINSAKHSADKNQFQTVEVENQNIYKQKKKQQMKPNLPKSQNKIQKNFQTVADHDWDEYDNNQDRPRGQYSGSVNLRGGDSSHQINDSGVTTSEQHLTTQTMTFRKDKTKAPLNNNYVQQPYFDQTYEDNSQMIDQMERDLNQEEDGEYGFEGQEQEYQPHNQLQKKKTTMQSHLRSVEDGGRQYADQRNTIGGDSYGDSAQEEFEERNSQKETIQLYASREVSNRNDHGGRGSPLATQYTNAERQRPQAMSRQPGHAYENEGPSPRPPASIKLKQRTNSTAGGSNPQPGRSPSGLGPGGDSLTRVNNRYRH